MDGERSRFEELLDYVLYAPIGAIERLTKDPPSLIDEGRARIEGRVNTARIIGRFALSSARGRLERYLFEEPATEREHVEPAGVATKEDQGRAEKPQREVTSRPGDGDLAIVGYDDLTATQIVSRLGGLSRNELAKIRRYEESNRHRRTILGRIAQLDGSQQKT